ncbi:hypothetical protein [Pontibacter sp. 13R65]|uniref:hypothetical protein n=1 Tax=Pontibacter sp. 13R65 TaxID=3127458 RepID=UPI00301E12A7
MIIIGYRNCTSLWLKPPREIRCRPGGSLSGSEGRRERSGDGQRRGPTAVSAQRPGNETKKHKGIGSSSD